MSASHPVAPRDYAAAILAEPALERRQQLLERCPVEWRAQVEEHVRSAYGKIVAYRQHQAGRAEQAREKPPAAARRDSCVSIINHSKSAPEVGNNAIARLRSLIQGAAHGC